MSATISRCRLSDVLLPARELVIACERRYLHMSHRNSPAGYDAADLMRALASLMKALALAEGDSHLNAAIQWATIEERWIERLDDISAALEPHP